MSARIRIYTEERRRTIPTGDGFVTTEPGDVVAVVVAKSWSEAADALRKLERQDREELAKLNEAE